MSVNATQGLYYNPYLYNNYNTLIGNTDATTTIPLTGNVSTTVTPQETTAKDGKDDGKISFWDKCKNVVKGVGKAIGGAVCSIIPGASHVAKALGWKDAPSFSLKNAAIAVGAVALSIACPPAGVAIAAAGAIKGAVDVGKGIYGAATATTDADAEAAFQNIGAGGLEVGLSVAGVKGGLKAMKGVEGSAMSTATTTAEKVKAFGTDFKSSIKGGNGYEGLTNIAKAKYGAIKEAGDGSFKAGLKAEGKTAYNNAKESVKTKYGEFKEKIDPKTTLENAKTKIAEGAEKIKNTDAKAALADAKTKLGEQFTKLKNAKSKISYQNAKAKVLEQYEKLKQIDPKEALNQAKQLGLNIEDNLTNTPLKLAITQNLAMASDRNETAAYKNLPETSTVDYSNYSYQELPEMGFNDATGQWY
ncbi:MAG: hypothetical protein PHV37_06390 [Candidatus Gastranaerophilales bacterium]|nr:hypothetical protein [Candidatus Gastranaerophilales bacterium]